MRQGQQPRYLTRSEYISSDQSESTEVAGARWEFMGVVRQVLPRFFEQLRKQIYPHFARLAEGRPGYWGWGWRFETWQLHSDRDHELTPHLLAWARRFHAEETWILEGALQTLWLWHRHPEWRECLDICGFRSYRGVRNLTGEEEPVFRFEHPGWDPQLERWASYRAHLQAQFTRALGTYEERLRALVESRGARRARYRYSMENFEWFALYQLAGMPVARILEQRSELRGDASTIHKGVKAAAALLQWRNIRPAGKKAPRSF